MNFKYIAAAAALAFSGLASAASEAIEDGGDLGTLSASPVSLYASVSKGTFSADYTFNLSGESDLTGSLYGLLNAAKLTFSSVTIDNVSFNGLSGNAFSFDNVAAGLHTLSVSGSSTGSALFIGSVYASPSAVVVPTPAVPEPESMALALAGLGVAGFVARRRKQA